MMAAESALYSAKADGRKRYALFDEDLRHTALQRLELERDMRRALVTAFGNARLAERYRVEPEDLPRTGNAKSRIGFLQ